MAQVVWSPSSLGDLDAFAEFVVRDSAHCAGLHVQGIVPEYGREDLREFIPGNYRIVCGLRGDLIGVAVVVHGARGMPDLLP